MSFLKYLLFSSFFLIHISSYAQEVKKNDMMVIYIHKFTDYVDWSSNSDFYDSNQFTITFFGKTSLENKLESYLKTQKINNKKIKIYQVFEVDNIQRPEILFISDIAEEQLVEILEYTKNKPILTISESKGFGKKGVLINFFTFQNTLRFEINKNGVEKANIKMNSYLYRVAKIIE